MHVVSSICCHSMKESKRRRCGVRNIIQCRQPFFQVGVARVLQPHSRLPYEIGGLHVHGVCTNVSTPNPSQYLGLVYSAPHLAAWAKHSRTYVRSRAEMNHSEHAAQNSTSVHSQPSFRQLSLTTTYLYFCRAWHGALYRPPPFRFLRPIPRNCK